MTIGAWVRCPAKINTYLRVTGRRADGYHDLDTEFVSLALHDRLRVDRAAGFALELASRAGEELPVAGNLVLEAARHLQQEVGRRSLPGAAFRLEKRVPAAAGLGGGSSDAAAALAGLVRVWQLAPPEGLLERIALAVGSDVPFFLRGGRQRGRSRGELLEPLPDLAVSPVVLVRPRLALSTREVFRRLSSASTASGTARSAGMTPLTTRNAETSFGLGPSAKPSAGDGGNDLWPAAIDLAPALARLREDVRRLLPGALVEMTGSGPTLFALFPPGPVPLGVEAALGPLAAAGAEVLVTRTTSAAEYEATRFEP